MIQKKKSYGHQLGPMTHLLNMFHSANAPQSAELCKNPYYFHFLGRKRGQIGKNSKKGCCGHKLQTMTHFFTNRKFDPLLYLQPKMLDTHLCSFFFVLIIKKGYRQQLGPMTHFFTNQNLTHFHIYGTNLCSKIFKAPSACPNS